MCVCVCVCVVVLKCLHLYRPCVSRYQSNVCIHVPLLCLMLLVHACPLFFSFSCPIISVDLSYVTSRECDVPFCLCRSHISKIRYAASLPLRAPPVCCRCVSEGTCIGGRGVVEVQSVGCRLCACRDRGGGLHDGWWRWTSKSNDRVEPLRSQCIRSFFCDWNRFGQFNRYHR
jgi:hypothetical protein